MLFCLTFFALAMSKFILAPLLADLCLGLGIGLDLTMRICSIPRWETCKIKSQKGYAGTKMKFRNGKACWPGNMVRQAYFVFLHLWYLRLEVQRRMEREVSFPVSMYNIAASFARGNEQERKKQHEMEHVWFCSSML